MTEDKSFDELIDGNLAEYTSHLAFLRFMIETSQKADKEFDKLIPQNNDCAFEEIIHLHSFGSLLTISLLDLLVISKHLQHSRQDWEKIYFLKQAYLIIYETIDTYKAHNKILNDYFKGRFSELKSDYLEIQEELKTFRKNFSYESKIKNIRNNIAGHIEKNFSKYYDTLLILKNMNGINAINSFINILKASEELYLRLVSLSNALAEKESEDSGLKTEQLQHLAFKGIEDLRKKFDK